MNDLFPPMPSPKINRGKTDDAYYLWEFLRMNMWSARANKQRGISTFMQLESARSCCFRARLADRGRRKVAAIDASPPEPELA